MGLHFLHNFLVTYLGPAGVLLKFMVFLTFAFLFFVLLYILAFRDRAIVLRGLADEVGVLLHPKEFKLTTSGTMLIPLWNMMALMGSPKGYMSARKKQLLLADLAFLKNRVRRGETSAGITRKIADVKSKLERLNQEGVFVGKM